MGFYFIKTDRHRKFNHIPIYYDESKEELEQMKREAEVEAKGTNPSDFKPNVKGQFSKRRISEGIQFGGELRRKSNLRLGMIIIALLLVAYLIMKSGTSFLDVFLK